MWALSLEYEKNCCLIVVNVDLIALMCYKKNQLPIPIVKKPGFTTIFDVSVPKGLRWRPDPARIILKIGKVSYNYLAQILLVLG